MCKSKEAILKARQQIKKIKNPTLAEALTDVAKSISQWNDLVDKLGKKEEEKQCL
jgi:tellurite resistance protein